MPVQERLLRPTTDGVKSENEEQSAQDTFNKFPFLSQHLLNHPTAFESSVCSIIMAGAWDFLAILAAIILPPLGTHADVSHFSVLQSLIRRNTA